MGRLLTGRRSPSWRISLAATQVLVGEDALLPQERAPVEGATAQRLAEFATGRHCARLALASLDPHLRGVPVLRDPRGAPTWPPGIAGSITHCSGWTGAVVARSRRSRLGGGVAAIGLDAEPIAPLPAGVLDVVASGREQDALRRLEADRPGIPWDTLLFSAKEATYKAWYPLTGIVLSHAAVEVALSPDGSFSAEASAADARGHRLVHGLRGRWTLGPRVVVALGVVG